MPFFSYAAMAAAVPAGVAGKTMPSSPTVFWHSSEAR